MTAAPYPAPAKCEGLSRNPRYAGAAFGVSRMMRCQRPPTTWDEERYEWVCDVHARARKVSTQDA